MPRRGEHQRDFPSIDQPAHPERVGVRAVRAPDRAGVLREITLDPAEFGCRVLAGELADEWVDYVEIGKTGGAAAMIYRRALRAFCATVDSALADQTERASLAKEDPDLAMMLVTWERTLPAGFRAGSTAPAVLASAVRALIARRAHHDQRPIDARLRRVIDGEVGIGWGTTQELDEFSRPDKRALVRAAWEYVHELDQRLTAGWALAQRGTHPDENGWTDVANLLWGLAHERISPRDIRDNLPVVHDWPPALRDRIEHPDRPVYPARAKEILARWLVRQLYPDNLDLHAFRVLLVAATGHAPEEVTTLTDDDVEFLPSGVRLTLTKRRARRVQHRTFTGTTFAAPADHSEAVEFVDRPHREAGGILRRLLRATEPARRRGDIRRLFVAASVGSDYGLRFARWATNHPRSRFVEWLDAVGVTVEGAPDIRRLRKSTKVEKAIAFGGRIADAATDHHEDTFRGHYAQGTTLRVLSGRVVATAQDHWFRQAVDGPTVLTDTATDALSDPGGLAALGITAQQAEDLRQGALDMGVSHCRDPYDSPYSPQGELCAVAPLRCLECRNAWILPSSLPQLLLFADHLDRLRNRLSPQHFAALWGQSYVNLHAVLAERSDEEKAVARKHIDDGAAGLHLPLAANVEFDA